MKVMLLTCESMDNVKVMLLTCAEEHMVITVQLTTG